MTSADMQASAKLETQLKEAEKCQKQLNATDFAEMSPDQLVLNIQKMTQMPITGEADKVARETYIKAAKDQLAKLKREADQRIEARRKEWIATGNALKSVVANYNAAAEKLDAAIAEMNRTLGKPSFTELQKEFGGLVYPGEYKNWNKKCCRLHVRDEGGFYVDVK